jgi:hypothetical protein
MNSNINELSYIGGIRKKLDSHKVYSMRAVLILDLKEGMKGPEEDKRKEKLKIKERRR